MGWAMLGGGRGCWALCVGVCAIIPCGGGPDKGGEWAGRGPAEGAGDQSRARAGQQQHPGAGQCPGSERGARWEEGAEQSTGGGLYLSRPARASSCHTPHLCFRPAPRAAASSSKQHHPNPALTYPAQTSFATTRTTATTTVTVSRNTAWRTDEALTWPCAECMQYATLLAASAREANNERLLACGSSLWPVRSILSCGCAGS
ncbi:hypothetical protein CALCODRAFT_222573 [Calocera cornea HHB12733]|uniref:Uncharacterized protein n=1 Tax=Calocera cornea HHB12733 TaxID=1353952 RepID=A0A165H4X3_9BASI|nr:hypothetical protein CALCODRAFT_222573 [Calocera cornea HHB12733]